jgi:hypothetical protein
MAAGSGVAGSMVPYTFSGTHDTYFEVRRLRAEAESGRAGAVWPKRQASRPGADAVGDRISGFLAGSRGEPLPEWLTTNGHQCSLAKWMGKTPREVALSQATQADIAMSRA